MPTHAIRLAPALVVATLSSWPAFTARAQSAGDSKPSKLESTVDATIKPGDDFFAYANGSWLKATTIPAGKERWGARDEINERSRSRVATLLDDVRANPRGPIARKLADFGAAYSNEAAIESRGLAALKPLLDSIDRVHDIAQLTLFLGRGVRADVDPLNWGVYQSSHVLGLSVEPSIHGERHYVAFLVQGGLGLPDREYYVSNEPRMHALRARYREFADRMLTLAGLPDADRRAQAVVALETAIAQSQGTREASANDRNADTVWSHPDFAREAPGMNWHAFFTAAGLGEEDAIVPWQPSAVRGVAALVASQPLEVWKDYLRLRALDTHADALPRAFAEEAWALHGVAVGGTTQQSPRAERARAATQLAMSDAIGQLYAERYFPADQKARVSGIVANVTAAFVKRLEAATWMTPATKAIALAKVKSLYVGIGYPERWQDYTDLVVDPLDAIGNLRRVANRNYRRAVAHLGKPVGRSEWLMAPQTAGAILIFQQNAYDFSAALLQAPKFDATASDAAHYGAIGAIIGHDVVHFVDVLGADYDTTGRMRRWWTSEDSARYQALAEPLANQFSGYRPLADVSVNGKLTQTENIADLAGLGAAFDAYRLTLGTRVNDKAYVRTHDREFFIAFAQSWRAKISETGMRAQAATNDHAPENYRIATVRNIDAWYDAFDVRPGQRLYVAPAARVRIW